MYTDTENKNETSSSGSFNFSFFFFSGKQKLFFLGGHKSFLVTDRFGSKVVFFIKKLSLEKYVWPLSHDFYVRSFLAQMGKTFFELIFAGKWRK